MSETVSTNQSQVDTWGWRIVAVVAGLLCLNGIAWFFAGPRSVLSRVSDMMGLSVTDLTATHPDVAGQLTANARQVAIYLTAIGAMGVLAAVAGNRRRARWAWHITWIIVATPAAIALTGVAVGAGLSGFVGMMMVAALAALVGQMLAGRTDWL